MRPRPTYLKYVDIFNLSINGRGGFKNFKKMKYVVQVGNQFI